MLAVLIPLTIDLYDAINSPHYEFKLVASDCCHPNRMLFTPMLIMYKLQNTLYINERYK